ncbi:S-formylglutathione hydrolase FrmB [Labedaea rhizosphaerae]|uniref:S-formylglutathione hydrolase FrmB n=2 Tax=Labedaea rhizosphaerae TaxID=598644 RepID=A0A4R6SCK6_LABRH|nr:S-formylglutathione hydrolase FrmB [Labedaea rhizosphaerae]
MPPARAGEPLVIDVQRQSAARGRGVRVIAMFPGDRVERLPVVLALHGRGATAGFFLDLGVPAMLAAAVEDGVAPFAVLAVDGGDSYWVAGDPGDDPQKMLADEVPGWLAEFGLIESPSGAFGISMGAYGALNYVRAVPGPPSAAVLSPALFTDWAQARARHVFASEGQWAATEPLRHLDDLQGALGVWCGTSDPFLPAAKELVAGGRTSVDEFTSGGHDPAYWRSVLPDALRFLGGVIR